MENENEYRQGKGRELCGICGKPISEDEDKVYCPYCGTPMHRVCFNITHTCPNEEFHQYASEPHVNKPASDEPVCDICGLPLGDNDEKVYCPDCGTPVHRHCWDEHGECPNSYRHCYGYDWNADHSSKKERPGISDPGTEFFTSYKEMAQSLMNNPVRFSDNGEELTCDGIRQDELLHFLGTDNISTPRFFTLFLNMANGGRKISFNIAALFFSPFYHFYRRMTGPAIVLTLARFILMVPDIIYFNTAALNAAAGLEIAAPGMITYVTEYLSLALQILLFLFSDFLYMKWTVNRILTLREQYKDVQQDEYYAVLESKGNPRFMYILAGIGLLMFMAYALSLFINASGIL